MADRTYKSDETASVQQWLNSHGFDCGKVDGVIGSKTKNAIKQAQVWLKSQGLYTGNIDGIVGEKTLAGMVTVSDIENNGGNSGLKHSKTNAPWQTPSDVREGIPDYAGILPEVKVIANKQEKAKKEIAKNNTVATVKVAYGTLHVDKNGKVTSKEGPKFGLGPGERSSLERDRRNLEIGLANGTIVINKDGTVTAKNRSNRLSPKEDAAARKEAEETISNNMFGGLKSAWNWVKSKTVAF